MKHHVKILKRSFYRLLTVADLSDVSSYRIKHCDCRENGIVVKYKQCKGDEKRGVVLSKGTTEMLDWLQLKGNCTSGCN